MFLMILPDDENCIEKRKIRELEHLPSICLWMIERVDNLILQEGKENSKGVLNCFPDILSAHKGAVQKRKECEKLTAEQKMNNSQMADVNRRTDIVSYAVIAEISHFRSERETHLKQTLKSLIDEQIKFYTGVVSRLQDAYAQFD